jgi:hypothetical protein
MQTSDGQFYWQDGDLGYGTSSTRQVIPPLLDTPFPISRVAGLTHCPITEIQLAPGGNIYFPIISKS